MSFPDPDSLEKECDWAQFWGRHDSIYKEEDQWWGWVTKKNKETLGVIKMLILIVVIAYWMCTCVKTVCFMCRFWVSPTNIGHQHENLQDFAVDASIRKLKIHIYI